jgi:enamine deaminase RidA (YjgF/YER057c/UK114 family)
LSRRVSEVVDANGLYFSRAASAGPLVFLASVAVDDRGQIPEEAKAAPPYQLSRSATVTAQANYIFRKYKSALADLGSSISDIAQVEQYIPLKSYADAYLSASRAPEFLKERRPASALIEVGELVQNECVINPTAIAVIPGEKTKKELFNPRKTLASKDAKFGDAYAEEPIYNELVRVGGYFFTAGDVAFDLNGIAPEARVNDSVWWGNEVRNETDFILKLNESRLRTIGASLEDVVHASVCVTDPGDLFEMDQVWKKYFKVPPARFVTPIKGLGVPRKEGAKGQAENAVSVEMMTMGVVPREGVEKEIIKTDRSPMGHESVAVRAGPTLWISGQLAADKTGLVTKSDAKSQIDYVLQNIQSICKSGGTTLHNLVRICASVTSKQAGYDLFKALKVAIPSNPPTVTVNVVPGSLQVPDCSVLIGGTAYVP